MNENLSPSPTGVSAKKIEANRRNAQNSPGPRDTRRSRFNAVKHGLTARVAWPGQNLKRNQEFFRYCWQRLNPRDAVEETSVGNLLQTRLLEDLFLDVEAKVLTRRPIFHSQEDGEAFPFLHDPDGLSALEQLARHLAHFTLVSDKEFLALLTARKEDSGVRAKSVEALGVEQPQSQATETTEGELVPPVNRGLLEDCLADRRLILPEEDPEVYQSLARALWSRFQPSNLLEGFVVCDFIQAQWRLDRVLNMQMVLFRQRAVSASGHDCGFGFAFIADVQGCEALDTLRNYEAVLRKRLDKRMALWRKLRKAGWSDANVPTSTQPSAGPPSPIPQESTSSPTHTAPNCPTSQPTSEPAPALAASSSDTSGVPMVQKSSLGPVCPGGGPSPPDDFGPLDKTDLP